jgi:hypothetical protein
VLVLLLVFLVLVLVLLLLLVVVVVATELIVVFLWTPNNRQIDGIFRIFLTRSKQTTLYIPVFFALLELKTTVFTMFLGQSAKMLVFTHFSPCCKM